MPTEPTEHKKLPDEPKSYWRDSTNFQDFSPLSEHLKADVTIVGGGITGITTAYLLLKEGIKVALIDADQILNGTTAHTTAKLTAQHDLIYDEFIQHFGLEKAKLYYQANNEALKFIKNFVTENEIECDLTQENAYIYTQSDKKLSKLEKELNAYQQLGIQGGWHENIPINLNIKAAISMNDQAQFHPLKYLHHLVQSIIKMGGMIYEHTTAIDIERGTEPKVLTHNGYHITSNFVITCSHFPFDGGTGMYFSRMYADRSYILAVKSDTDYPGGMYLSAEKPKRSLRYTTENGEKLILIAGESHKTGQGTHESEHYKQLEIFGSQVLGMNEIKYKWSTQDLTTLDKLPYVGQLTSNQPNLLVATGFRKWGMTNSTASAFLLRDLVVKDENPYKDLYSPSRFYMDPSLKKYISMNADVTKHLIKGKLEIPLKQPKELKHGEGDIVSLNGERVGAYKDNEGQLHMVDTTCTHMGCEVSWNSGDHTWDCPCHGSRFSIKGEVVEGPAKKPLQTKEE